MPSIDDLIAYVANLIAAILGGIQSAINQAVAAVQSYVQSLAQTIGSAIQGLIQGIVPQLTTIITEVIESLKSVLAPMIAGVTDLIAGLKTAITTVVDSLEKAISGLWDKITAAFEKLLDWVSDAVNTIQTKIGTLIDTAIETIKGWVSDAAAWVKSLVDQGLKALSDTYDAVAAAIRSGIQTVYDAVAAILAKLTDLITAAWKELVTGAESIISTVNDRIGGLAKEFDKAATQLGGSLDTFATEQIGPLKDAVLGFLQTVAKPLLPESYEGLVTAVEEAFAVGTLDIRSDQGLQRFFRTMVPNEAFNRLFFYTVFGLFIGTELFKGVVSANAETILQDFNMRHPWRLLSEAQVVEAYRHDNIDQAGVLKTLMAAGFTQEDAVRVIKNSETVPALGDLINMYLRGIITPQLFTLSLDQLGLNADWADKVRQLAQEIPPLPDIIRMARRLVFDDSQVATYKLLDDFQQPVADWAAKLGLSKDWALRFWAAHWDVPSVQQGFEMFQRGVIGQEPLDFLMRDGGVAPYWRPLLQKIAYHPFTRVDIRRMHKVGVLKDSQLVKAYSNIGYSPDDASVLADFTIALNKGKAKPTDEQLGTLTKAQIVSFYGSGLINHDKAMTLLQALGVTAEAAALFLSNEDLAQHVSDRKAKVAHIIELAKAGLMTQDQAVQQLNQLGLSDVELQNALTQLTRAFETKAKLPGHADLEHFLMAGLIAPEDYLTVMEAHGFSSSWANLYLKLTQGKMNAPKKSRGNA